MSRALPFNDAVERERNLSLPDSAFEGSALVRRKLFQGQALSGSDMMPLTGRTSGLINMVVKGMKLRGFQFEELRETPSSATKFRLMNPELRVDQFDTAAVKAYSDTMSQARLSKQQVAARRRGPVAVYDEDEPEPPNETAHNRRLRLDRNRKRQLRINKGAKSNGVVHVPVMAEVNGHEDGPVPPLPAFNSEVRITLLAEHDGGIRIGFKDDSGAMWLCRVEGHVAVS